MKLATIIKFSFLGGLITASIGAFLKILHAEVPDMLLAICLVLNVIFIATSVYEVRSSIRIDFREKTMWTIALLFMPGLSGIVYFLLGRRRV